MVFVAAALVALATLLGLLTRPVATPPTGSSSQSSLVAAAGGPSGSPQSASFAEATPGPSQSPSATGAPSPSPRPTPSQRPPAAAAPAPRPTPRATPTPPRPKPRPTTRAWPSIGHIYDIVLENHELGSIIGNSSAPYINGLARRYGLATNYTAASHPSLPNYLE